MKVPMLDPSRGNSPFIEELIDTTADVIRGGKYILGDTVNIFENNIAKYLGVKHAIGVSSGTDALLLSLMALEVGPGDEIICPSFTFFATAGSIARTGATPVFVNIYPDCFTCDIDSVKEAITSKTVGIIPVHLFGQCANMDPIMRLADEYNLKIIEDAAQAIGSEYNSQKAGNLGHIGCFSFFPSKNLGGFGDAGLITTNDDLLADQLKVMRVHGAKEVYKHDCIGGNFRIDAMQAALLNIKLKYLPELERKRIEHANYYINKLKFFVPNCLELPVQVRGKHVYNQFTIRVKNNKRNDLQKFLQSREISTGIYYPLPLHKQECFSYLFQQCITQSFSNDEDFNKLILTDLISKECLSIPIASELTDQEIEYVANNIIEFFK